MKLSLSLTKIANAQQNKQRGIMDSALPKGTARVKSHDSFITRGRPSAAGFQSLQEIVTSRSRSASAAEMRSVVFDARDAARQRSPSRKSAAEIVSAAQEAARKDKHTGVPGQSREWLIAAAGTLENPV